MENLKKNNQTNTRIKDKKLSYFQHIPITKQIINYS